MRPWAREWSAGPFVRRWTLIAENAGYEAPVVVEDVRSGEGDWGFNAETGEYTHLIQAGIIDPVKVTRSALENAGSIAGMMLTTETIITEIPEVKPLPADHAGLHVRLRIPADPENQPKKPMGKMGRTAVRP